MIRTSNAFSLNPFVNLVDLQEANPTTITNGFTQQQFEDIVYPFLTAKYWELDAQLSSTLEFISINSDPLINGYYTINRNAYFNACSPTNCQRTLTNTVRDQLLASLSFAGGLLPLYTVILTIFYTITAKCWRNVLKPLYRDIHFKEDQTGSDVELKTPTSNDV